MTKVKDKGTWSAAVLARDECACRWTGCTRPATDAAHAFARWYPSLALVVEDGLAMCRNHHVHLDGLSREKRRAVLRLLLGRRRYEELAELAHGVNLQ